MSTSTFIETARVRDASTLNKLFIQSIDSSFTYFTQPYQEQLRREHSYLKFVKALCSSRSCFLLARLQNKAVGYSLARIDTSDTGFIHWMYILPSMQGKGLGAALLEASMQRLTEKGIRRIRLLTHDQVGFYEHSGFEERGRIHDYSGGVPMTIMELVV